MQAGRPSWTARAVAGARAFATQSRVAAADARDAVAAQMLPAPLGTLIEVARHPALAPLVLHGSLGLIDHVALRTAIIDRHIEEAAAHGVRQLVIVGAGLDTRAHRLECLRDVSVLELDFPSTQVDKRARTASLPVLARALRYASLDLEHDSLRAILLDVGHDSQERTLWIMEGVAPYLRGETLVRVLADLADSCGSGSRLLLTYVPRHATWLARARPVVDAVLRIAGEPLGAPTAPAEVRALAERAGLRFVSDTGSKSWARTVATNASRRLLVSYERMLVVDKP